MDPMNQTRGVANASTGLRCPQCCAPAGEPCAPGCSEAGLAGAVRKAIDMLAQVDVSKALLAVPAAIGVLRSALDDQANCDAARFAKLLQICTEARTKYGPKNELRSVTMTFKTSVETSVGYRETLRKLVDDLRPTYSTDAHDNDKGARATKGGV